MMFRAATRALPTRALQARAMSSSSKAPTGGFTWIIGMPVDVYPLAAIVTLACSGSGWIMYKHLVEDSKRGELRLLPSHMQ
ncbi:hypothetical protein CspeluHIS016_0104220 [Cutaneotrichosporon spelunceum]|uniref:Uncharacterized protein n=1 Tax=Cutaneotrichosporon spelunceum TaxID=1672016 RepID=A0AAD3TP01_9TREE|nr:hypothetical protein CspeluHIS016_0104220 [Cutaneotrichosporon spelunceum]